MGNTTDPPKPTILLIDDELQIRKLLEINLENNGYQVIQAENGRAGLAMAASYSPDLILVDIGLPDLDGKELVKDLRVWFHRPIIVISVLNSESEIVTALDNGASDFITKPFRINELLARIRASLKRVHAQESPSSIIQFDDLWIDSVSRVVKKNDINIKLTQTEFNLLNLLAYNSGRVLTHQFLLKEIWGLAYQMETQYLRVFIGNLRKKIEDNPMVPRHIITESRVGYRFV